MEPELVQKPIEQKEQPEKQEQKLSNEDKNKQDLECFNDLKEELKKPHATYEGQPNIYNKDKQVKPGAIKALKVEDISKEPQKLPEGYKWCQIDINNPVELSELSTLLTENFSEHAASSFKFNYSPEFLKWVLMPPNYQKSWLVGIRGANGKLCGSITGAPVNICVEDNKIKMAEINYLCVDKSLRKMGPVQTLTKEIIRRVHLRDKWQGIYTSSASQNQSQYFCQVHYWHRYLNPRKLIDINFFGLGTNQTKGRLQKLYKLPEETTIQGLRPMNKKDIFAVTQLINKGLQKYVVKFRFTEEDVKHYFLPIPHVIYSYVVQKDKEVTDFLSFYSLTSPKIQHEKYKALNVRYKMMKVCYSYYNFANTVKLQELIFNALILAKNADFDVYNCLDIMQNVSVFETLYFKMGNEALRYHLYNWNMKNTRINSSESGVVMV